MQRTSIMVIATAAAVAVLAGCGSDTDTAADANGLRRNSTTTASAPHTEAPESSATPEQSQEPGTEESAPVNQPDPDLGPASQTTCAEFKQLQGEAEKARIEEILAENPGSPFEGSPNVALGTAKLVCLSASQADTPVAKAAGIVKR
ncbi:hypothetical protein [Nocardia callitridis]